MNRLIYWYGLNSAILNIRPSRTRFCDRANANEINHGIHIANILLVHLNFKQK